MNFKEWKEKVTEAVERDIKALGDNITKMRKESLPAETVKVYVAGEIAHRKLCLSMCTPDNIVGVDEENSVEAAVFLEEAYNKVINYLDSELETMERLT